MLLPVQYYYSPVDVNRTLGCSVLMYAIYKPVSESIYVTTDYEYESYNIYCQDN